MNKVHKPKPKPRNHDDNDDDDDDDDDDDGDDDDDDSNPIKQHHPGQDHWREDKGKQNESRNSS